MPTNHDAPAQVPNKWDPWPAGDYAFEVVSAEEKLSKRSDRPMIELRLRVFDTAGHARMVFDWLPLSERALWKREAAAAATGLLEVYESGGIEASDFVGRTGWLALAVQAATDEYPAKNTVRTYIGAAAPSPQTPPKPRVQVVPGAFSKALRPGRQRAAHEES